MIEASSNFPKKISPIATALLPGLWIGALTRPMNGSAAAPDLGAAALGKVIGQDTGAATAANGFSRSPA
ncbi:hypothetical protein GCM10017709_03110 [Glutamicibacter nicotianae]|uniref:Uncharacterized protein n=1 Tax=Glutamicibacter nicotianae TaxID=37929 RepID=A0ABQ0RKZ7_GLUNI|nr:hypothetical protein ANI01nite_17030 [Glutamicibacter nicotianae]